jgi:hypothetical protein
MFRPSELSSDLGIVFVELAPSSDKLFRPPFMPKKDHIVKDLDIYIYIYIDQKGVIYRKLLLPLGSVAEVGGICIPPTRRNSATSVAMITFAGKQLIL